jgi:uncharacterized protein (TIGR03000 family)
MNKRFLSLAAMSFLTTAALFLLADPAWAQRGSGGRGGGGHSGGVRPAGGGGVRPAGDGVSPTGGFGGVIPAGNVYSGSSRSNGSVASLPNNGGYRSNGIGVYTPYYAIYKSYYIGAVGSYLPYSRGVGAAAYFPITIAGSGYPPALPGTQLPAEKPAPDGSAHLLLTVPENAEVLIEGTKTTQTGTTREFVTPQLNPGTRYVYEITVRYSDSRGNVVDDTRDIRFGADDWFSIDFTRPAPPAPLPLPRIAKDE